MDPNYSFSSNPNHQVPQETPSMAIPEDPFISPLYEAMFPFGTTPTISSTITPYNNLSFDPNYSSTTPPPPPMFSINGESHDDPSYPQLFPTTEPGYFMSLLNSDLPTYSEASFSFHSPSQSSHQQSSSEEVAPDHQAFDNNMKVTEDSNNINQKSTCSYTYSKYKYVCEPCRVYFSTPQALGGHMSYHSKERKGMPIAPIRRSSSVYGSGKTHKNNNPTQPKKCINDDDKGKDILINIDINDIDNVSSATTGEIDLDNIIPWGTQVEFNNLLEEGEKEATIPDHEEDLQMIMTDVDVNAMINEMFVDFDCTFEN